MRLAQIPETVDAPELVSAMDMVRSAVSAAHSLRKTHGLRVRQPLKSLTIVDDSAAKLADFTDLIAGEVNVKQVKLLASSESGLQLQRQLKLNPKHSPLKSAKPPLNCSKRARPGNGKK